MGFGPWRFESSRPHLVAAVDPLVAARECLPGGDWCADLPLVREGKPARRGILRALRHVARGPPPARAGGAEGRHGPVRGPRRLTAQAESHDPEDVRSILTAYYARLRVELERHGGTVEKFIGDAVMAVFGAPVAHEDDPERAVRAALAIRDGARRVGGSRSASPSTPARRSSHWVPRRRGRGDGRGRRRQHGGAPADRARRSNGILVGEATYRATEHAIQYAGHRAVTAKGKSEPMPVREALEPRARFGVDVERGMRARRWSAAEHERRAPRAAH